MFLNILNYFGIEPQAFSLAFSFTLVLFAGFGFYNYRWSASAIFLARIIIACLLLILAPVFQSLISAGLSFLSYSRSLAFYSVILYFFVDRPNLKDLYKKRERSHRKSWF
jgi:hypothetical protein